MSEIAGITEKELGTIFEQSPLSIVLTDTTGTIVRVSKKMEELSGYTEAELIGQNPRILKSHKTPKESYEEMWKTITSGQTWRGEFINRSKNGKHYLEKATISPIFSDEGVITHFMAIKEDITTQHAYEKKIREQHGLITLLLSDFENQSTDWIWELDSSLCVTYVSEKINKRFPNLSIIGKPLLGFFREHAHPDDLEADERILALMKALHEGIPFREIEQKVVVEGRVKWISLSAMPKKSGADKKSAWRGVGRDITDKKLLEIELYRKANFDEQTGLPNRYRFKETVQATIASDTGKQQGILGIMQIMNLDLVRANLGSKANDDVIHHFISVFNETAGSGFFLARLSKDEFVFWTDINDVYQIELIHSFVKAMNEPLSIGADSYRVDFYTGLAFYPEDGKTTGDLFQAADLALNSAKTAAARNVMRYQKDLATSFKRRITIIHEFPQALSKRQFHMRYQGQFRADTGTLVGAEALIRWNHPTLGEISPGEFIPLAEKNGFITTVAEWTLMQACADAMEWQKPLPVSVNISGVQIRDPRRLSRSVSQALKTSGLPASRLILEITESAMFGLADEASILFEDLRDLGISIALDDFGTGYSSLAYLQKLHLDKLKIDQSFIASLTEESDSGKIVEIIIALAQSLKLDTIAEGVETDEQARLLRESGCGQIQGFLYARPEIQENFCIRIAEGR